MRFVYSPLAILFCTIALAADAPQRPTGALPSPRSKLVSTPRFKALLTPPASYLVVPQKLSYWGNQTFGNCVSASEAAAKACDAVGQGKAEIFIPEAEVIAWARKNGYLNGAYLTEVMDSMIQDGMIAEDGVKYGDGKYSAVDWTTPADLKSALVTGPVKIGVAAGQLQRVVGSTNGWILTGAYPSQNIDHAVELFGYGTLQECCAALKVPVPSKPKPDTSCYLLFTWSTIGIIDQGSLNAICGEAWIRSPTTVTQGPTPPTPTPTPTWRMSVMLKDLPAMVEKYQTGTDAEKAQVLSLLDKMEGELKSAKQSLGIAP